MATRSGSNAEKSRLRSALQSMPLFLRLFIVGCIGAAIAFYLLLPKPQTRTIFTGEVERVSTIVDFPDPASFRIGGMRALSDDDDGPCLNGLITPAAGVRVVYQRIGKGPLSIGMAFPKPAGYPDLRPTAQLVQADGSADPLELKGPRRLRPDPTCDGMPPTRLAIHGEADFGQELSLASVDRDYATGYLHKGRILVFVRSIESRLLHFRDPRIYRIQDVLVPPGARLKAERPQGDKIPPVWWGVARVEPDGPGLAVDAAINNARTLVVMAGGLASVETFMIGNVGDVTDDPTVFWFFGGLSAVLGIALSVAGSLITKHFESHLLHGKGKVDAQ